MDSEPQRGTSDQDDLSVARRAYARVQSKLEELRHDAASVRKSLERVERALDGVDVGRYVQSRLYKARFQLERMSARAVRVDGEQGGERLVRDADHRFVGMWRPPAPPKSPEDIGCIAIVCACLAHLTSAEQVRQHWETGCFDVPEYTSDGEESLEDECEEFETDAANAAKPNSRG